MKIITLSTLAILLGSSPVLAEPVIYKDDVVQFNPYTVCGNLFEIGDHSSYETWRQFQYCVNYFKTVDGVF